jgi:hypothetical protein
MKTLTNHTISGVLLVRDTGPEAAVGDQVKLFLNTTANPSFPSYILAVIQHPIEKVNCLTDTSYTFEYNEADLNGAAAELTNDDVIDVVVYSLPEQTADLISNSGNLNLTITPLVQDSGSKLISNNGSSFTLYFRDGLFKGTSITETSPPDDLIEKTAVDLVVD